MYPNAFIAFLNNQHIWIAAFSCVSAQILKGLIEYLRSRKWNMTMFFSTGGMPSSHSALVVAMATSIGHTEGLHSPLFAVACIFAIIVMYDAAGVRRAAGKHAEMINDLVESLERIRITPDKRLKELLGHSPIEVVAGAIWGIISASLAHEFLSM